MENKFYIYFTHDDQKGIEPLCECFTGADEDEAIEKLLSKYPTAEIDFIED